MKIKRILMPFVILIIFISSIFLSSAALVTYDFSSEHEGIDMWAREGERCNATSLNTSSKYVPLSTCDNTNEITSNSALDSSDDSRVDTREYVGWPYTDRGAFQIFWADLSSLDIDDISNLTWKFEGKTNNVAGCDPDFYIWNVSSSKWEEFSNSPLGTSDSTIVFDSINEGYNATDLINDTGFIFFGVIDTEDSDSGTYNYIYVDYIKLEVTSNSLEINLPTANQNISNTLSTTLNTSQKGYNETIWYSWNYGIINNTLCIASEECEDTITFPRQGYFDLVVWGNKTDGTVTNETINLLVDNRTTFIPRNDTYVSSGTIGGKQRIHTTCESTSNFGSEPFHIFEDDFSSYSGYEIVNASLKFYITASASAGIGANLSIYRVTSPIKWDSGCDVTDLFPTYNNPDSGTNWNFTSPFLTINSLNQVNAGGWANNWAIFDIRDQVIGIINGSYTFYGFSLNLSYPLSDIIGYYSEYTGDTSLRPLFNITYYTPNTAPNVTLITPNNTNFTSANDPLVVLEYNLTDDNDYVMNVSLYLNNSNFPVITYYYPNSTYSSGWNGSDDNEPPTTLAAVNYSISTSGLDNMSANDSNSFFTSVLVNSYHAVVRVLINIADGLYINDMNNLTLNNLTVTVIGHGRGYGISNFSLYVWNSTDWVHADSHNKSTKSTLSYTLDSSLTDYINASDDFQVLLTTQESDGATSSYVNVSYISVSANRNNSFKLNQTVIYPELDTNLNFTIEDIADGSYQWYIEVCDSDNNCTNSQQRLFTVDATPLTITIISPTEKTYSGSDIDFNVTLSEEGKSCVFSLNETANVTMQAYNSTYFNYTKSTGDGTYNVIFCCNDTTDNQACTSKLNFGVDVAPPIISLDYPLGNMYYNYKTNFQFNFTPDAGVSSIDTCKLWGNWTGTWHSNRTFLALPDDVQVNTTRNLTDGTYKWNVWCNESGGTTDWSPQGNLTFTIDTIFPDINITYPLNTTYNTNSLEINYSRKDINLESCWYTNDSGATNTTLSNCNNISYTAPQNSTSLIIYTNDSAGNTNSSNVTFYVDSINPSINITTAFTNGSYLNYNTSIEIYLIITDNLELESCWYSDNLGANTTFTCGTNLSLDLSEGLHTIYFYANDSLNNLNGTEVISFTPDVTFPLFPYINITTVKGFQSFDFEARITETNIDSCWYSIFNSSDGIDSATNENESFVCSTGVTFSLTDTVSDYASYNLTIYVNDSAGNENSTTEGFTTSRSEEGAGGGGDGGGGVIIVNETEIVEVFVETKGVCGNGLCEQDVGEGFINCPQDCGGLNIDDLILSCFDEDPNINQKCISNQAPILFWIAMILITLIALSMITRIPAVKRATPKIFLISDKKREEKKKQSSASAWLKKQQNWIKKWRR